MPGPRAPIPSRLVRRAQSNSYRRRSQRSRLVQPSEVQSRRSHGLNWVQLNVRVTLSAGKGAFGVIPEWVQGVAAGQMDESWINKHGQLDSKGGPWQNAFPKSRSLPGAKQV